MSISFTSTTGLTLCIHQESLEPLGCMHLHRVILKLGTFLKYTL